MEPTKEQKAEHTPGPWIFEPDDGSIRNGMHIATVYQFEDFPCADAVDEAKVRAECEANARLIAAAPDLLAACKAVVEWFDANGRTDDPSFGARAALTKAGAQ